MPKRIVWTADLDIRKALQKLELLKRAFLSTGFAATAKPGPGKPVLSVEKLRRIPEETAYQRLGWFIRKIVEGRRAYPLPMKPTRDLIRAVQAVLREPETPGLQEFIRASRPVREVKKRVPALVEELPPEKAVSEYEKRRGRTGEEEVVEKPFVLAKERFPRRKPRLLALAKRELREPTETEVSHWWGMEKEVGGEKLIRTIKYEVRAPGMVRVVENTRRITEGYTLWERRVKDIYRGWRRIWFYSEASHRVFRQIGHTLLPVLMGTLGLMFETQMIGMRTMSWMKQALGLWTDWEKTLERAVVSSALLGRNMDPSQIRSYVRNALRVQAAVDQIWAAVVEVLAQVDVEPLVRGFLDLADAIRQIDPSVIVKLLTYIQEGLGEAGKWFRDLPSLLEEADTALTELGWSLSPVEALLDGVATALGPLGIMFRATADQIAGFRGGIRGVIVSMLKWTPVMLAMTPVLMQLMLIINAVSMVASVLQAVFMALSMVAQILAERNIQVALSNMMVGRTGIRAMLGSLMASHGFAVMAGAALSAALAVGLLTGGISVLVGVLADFMLMNTEVTRSMAGLDAWAETGWRFPEIVTSRLHQTRTDVVGHSIVPDMVREINWWMTQIQAPEIQVPEIQVPLPSLPEPGPVKIQVDVEWVVSRPDWMDRLVEEILDRVRWGV